MSTTFELQDGTSMSVTDDKKYRIIIVYIVVSLHCQGILFY